VPSLGGADALGGVLTTGGVVNLATTAPKAFMTIVVQFLQTNEDPPRMDTRYLTNIHNQVVRRVHCRYP
jgi:hypothetical protein